jgi:hypothetical protein
MENRKHWQIGYGDGCNPSFLQKHADEKAAKLEGSEKSDYLEGFLEGRNSWQNRT